MCCHEPAAELRARARSVACRLLGAYARRGQPHLVARSDGVKDHNAVPDLDAAATAGCRASGGVHRGARHRDRLPNDESEAKLPFYAAHNVDEVLIVDPQARSVSSLGLEDGSYEEIEHSAVIDLGLRELAERIDWP